MRSLSEKHKRKISEAVKKNLPSTAFKKGHIPWQTGTKGIYKSSRKGRTYEEIYGKERANKIKSDMSLAKKGKTHVEIFGEESALRRKKQIRSLSVANIGKKRPDMVEKWKKLRSPINLNISSKELQRLRKHGRYKTWRKKVFEKFDCCVKCPSKENLETDHIIPIFRDRTLIFDVNNGQVLCKKCHVKKTREEYWEAEKAIA